MHATAIAVGPHGILLRGPSGAGKSLLALCLIEAWTQRGCAAALVSDDRVALEADVQGVVMHAPERLRGLIELRGRGIIERPFKDTARLALVVDLVSTLERMPEEHDFHIELLGHIVARCPVPQSSVIGAEHQRLLIEEALRATAIDW